jgi:hypothetical protein
MRKTDTGTGGVAKALRARVAVSVILLASFRARWSGASSARARRTSTSARRTSGRRSSSETARTGLVALAACVGMLGAGGAISPSALALNVHKFDLTFGAEGAGAGQLAEPEGVAVNNTTHDVYVVDHGNKRVEYFSASGVYLGQFAPPGGFQSPTWIAIDNSANPLDPSAGDVYVIDSVPGGRSEDYQAVDKFGATGGFEGQVQTEPLLVLSGIAVDAAGTLWLGEQVDESQGGLTGSYTDAQPNKFISRIPNFVSKEQGFAVDTEDRLYIGDAGTNMDQYLPGGETKEFVTGSLRALTVDTATNDVYATEDPRVDVYGTNGRLKEKFGEGHLNEASGVAVDPVAHMVYVADKGADKLAAFEQVVVPDVVTGEEPTNLGTEGSVTLDGTVNADGIQVTSCELEYGTTTAYGSTAPCEPDPGASSHSIEVHADVSGLTPLATYHYRLVASNANGSNAGIDRSFIAPVRATVANESVRAVSADSASFEGEVNPGGAPTTFRFEYGLSTAYGESVSGNAGAGVAEVQVIGHPQDLKPGQTYHYRLVAESQLGPVAGEDHAFSTEASTGAAELPDGRGYEMVSPPNKGDGSLRGIQAGTTAGELIQAAADGGSITYGASGPIEESPEGDRSPENVQILSRRGASGWATKMIATPHDAIHIGINPFSVSEYKIFSTDLSLGLVEPKGFTPLSAETSERTVYLRHDATCESDPSHCYLPLVNAANVGADVKFGGEDEVGGDLEIEGATPDFSHVVINSKVALLPGATAGLYEWTDGKLTFIAAMTFGYNGRTEPRHAISNDGTRIFGTRTSQLGRQELVMHDTVTGTTTRLDVAEPGVTGTEAGSPVFQTASADGSRVFFTDDVPLTVTSGANESGKLADLYECRIVVEVQAARCALKDLTPKNGEEAAAVQGRIIGASEDGTAVYFAADGVLTTTPSSRGERAKPGACKSEGASTAACNLYVSREGVTTFIAQLGQEDRPSFARKLRPMTARVSPNGQWLAFMSDKSLTGYDNRDAASVVPDEEVFLYHAGAGSAESQLVCVSCSPTNGRPAGVLDLKSGYGEGEHSTPLVDEGAIWDRRWIAALVPPWTSPEQGLTMYQSRYLSDNGRMFFDSHDALSPRDTNGTWDVYEYEPPEGAAEAPTNDTCTGESSTYSSRSGGCIDLISTGSSHEESAFMDASEGGNDVFFLTATGLVPQDRDGLLDLYDAHVCTAEVPCVAPAAVAPPPCTTEASCKASPTPQPEIFGAPASATFNGVGNLAETSRPVLKAKAATKAYLLAKALKGCRKDKVKKRRLVCERHARKRYGTAVSGASKTSRSMSNRRHRKGGGR